MKKKEKHRLLPTSLHGELEPVFDDIWVVKGQTKMPMLIPMKISRTMTIVRNPDNNELVLINSMRVAESLLTEIEKLGNITHVLTVGGFHGRDDGFYRERFGATVYALEGHVYSRKPDKGAPKPESAYMKADVYLNESSELPLPQAELKIINSSPKEGVLLLKRDGGILITGDSLQNTPEPDRFANFFAKFMMKKMGFYKPYNVGPAWLQFANPKKSEVQSLFSELEYEHVLPGHGNPVIGDAKNKYQPVIHGELKGCHE